MNYEIKILCFVLGLTNMRPLVTSMVSVTQFNKYDIIDLISGFHRALL